MQTIFKDPLTERVILVDTSNAFNSLNREVALHNIKVACSSFTYILINTYRTSSRIIIMGGAEIQSTDGATQSDNLVMYFHAIATINSFSASLFMMSNKFGLQKAQLVQVL